MRILVPFVFSFFVLCGCFSSDADFYERCNENADCASGTECWRVAFEREAEGRMCTDTCEADSQCPFGGACWGLEGDPLDQRVCFERCRTDFDCPVTFLCANAEMDGEIVDQICLPE